MKNFLIKLKKWLIILGLLAVAGIGANFLSKLEIKPEIKQIGAILCIDDSTKGVNERIVNCPVTNAIEKANIKSLEIAKIGSIAKLTHGKYQIEVSELKAIEGGVEFYARAWDLQGNPISLGTGVETEHFRIFNPPILVDDPNGTITREMKNSETGEIKYRKLREDLQEALLQTLEHTIFVSKKGINPPKGSIGHTTSTFYPDPTIPSTAVDGSISHIYALGSGVSWATLRAAAGTHALRASGDGDVLVRADNTTDNFRRISRLVEDFDTSSIPDTDTISSATASLFGNTSVDDFGSAVVSMIDNNIASVTAVAASDYYLNSNLIGGTNTKQATDLTLAGWSNIGYNDFTLNATGLANVSKTSITKFGFVIGFDQSNSAPTWADSSTTDVNVFQSDNAGTTQDPKLVVVHSAAVTAVPKGRTNRVQIYFNNLIKLAFVR